MAEFRTKPDRSSQASVDGEGSFWEAMPVMMVFLVILGAIMGGAFSRWPWGSIVGAALGYLLARSVETGRRISELRQALADLERRLHTLSTGPSEAASAQAEDEVFEIEPVFPERSRQAPHAEQPPGTAPSGEGAPAGASQIHADLVSRIWDTVRPLVTGGNLLVKVGVLVLFLGVAFLLKYAADRNLLPIEIRLMGVALGAMALLALGWRLRERREGYALVLQGGGVGVLYLTVFAALRLYSLLPAGLSLAVLIALGGLSGALAVFQNSRSLAVLAIAGGFLAPVLTSTGGGSHVMLFGYYALLNGSILGIAWFKAWRMLNLVGFIFTFGLGSMWGANAYRPEHFSTTEPFLILFFLFYTGVAVLFALRQPPRLKGYVDGTIVFGTPLIAFSLQALLVEPFSYGMAWSAFALGFFYLGCAWILFLRTPQSMRTLTEAFLSIGVAFGTLAVPLALDNRWTATAWALQGAAMMWIGVRQQRLLARISGILLQLGAGVSLSLALEISNRHLPVINGLYLGCLTVSLAGLFTSLCLYRNRNELRKWESVAGIIMGVWGLLWWFGAGLNEIDRHGPKSVQLGGAVLFFAATSLACDRLSRRLAWPLLRYPALGLLPGLLLPLWETAQSHTHPFAQGGFAAWPLAFAAYYLILYRNEDKKESRIELLHAGTLWMIALIGAWELSWQADYWIEGAGTWSLMAWGIVPSLLALLVSRTDRWPAWPILSHNATYITIGAGPLALYAWLWAMATNLSSRGDPSPLSYIPFINPLDLATAMVFVSLTAWLMRMGSTPWEAGEATVAGHRLRLPSGMPMPETVKGILAASIFLWLNAILVRTIHFWGGVAFFYHDMFRSMLLQASVSIFWSLTALGVMIFAARRKMRIVWFGGAALLGLVVLKLFFVDLASKGTVERIVSFIVVGILMLIIGYFSPVPPHIEKKGAAQ